MFKQFLFDPFRLPLIGLAIFATQAMSTLSPPVQAQGFYFESWRSGYGGRWGGFELGIGVRPSSPVPYGVRPSQIFPPIGVRPYGFGGPVVPFGFRDAQADYYDRLYRQYRAELDSPYRYGIDPRPQAGFNELQRRWAVPPLNVIPPVVTIEPFADGSGEFAQTAEAPLSVDELAQLLRSSAQRLSLALSRRGEEGQIWSDYLAPDTIVRVLDEGSDPRELGALLNNYDGVVSNGQLRWVMRTDGFAETRQWLHQYLLAVQSADAVGPEAEANQPEADSDLQENGASDSDELPPPPPMPDPPAPPATPASPNGGISL